MSQKLPFSHEIERDTLGMMIVLKECLEDGIVNLTEDHFHHGGHKAMWRQLQSLFTQEKPINDVVLSDAMRANGTLGTLCSMDMVFKTSNAGEGYEGAAWKHHFPDFKQKLGAYRQARVAVIAAEAMQEAAWRCDTVAIQAGAEEVLRATSESEARRRGVMWFDIGKQWIDRDLNALKGISTGFRWLDENLGGLRRGSLVVIAGGASDGKTTLALNILINAANDGHPIALFSQEMGCDENWERGLAYEKKVRSGAIMSGIFNRQEYEWMREYSLSKKPIEVFDDCAGMNEIEAEIRLSVARDKVRVVVVDYLQIVDGHKDETREREISEIGKRLKQLAKKYQITVIAMSQLNDDGKVRESRAIKQHCDQMLTILVKEDDDTSRCIKIEKNRAGKRYIKCAYRFIGEHFTFEEIGEITEKEERKETKGKNGHRKVSQFPS